MISKADNCGEGADCSGKGVCYSNASMVSIYTYTTWVWGFARKGERDRERRMEIFGYNDNIIMCEYELCGSVCSTVCPTTVI